jgi:hypothetical protein
MSSVGTTNDLPHGVIASGIFFVFPARLSGSLLPFLPLPHLPIPPISQTLTILDTAYHTPYLMADVTYTTAAGIWRRSGFVVIVSVLGTRIAVFPMDFLATCGNNTWDYVLFAVTCVIDVESQHPGKISDIQDRPVDLQAAPIEGTFCYVETGTP